jgi:primosomal protein N' (replication factor Y)
MGGHGRRRGSRKGGELRVASVVPDLPTFAVDEGFRYAATEQVAIGMVVRVPLGRRTVRGWVVAVEDDDITGLKPVGAVSSPTPIFDRHLLQTLRWAASYYVAPLAAVLPRAGPPNLPPSASSPPPATNAAARARAVYSIVGREAPQEVADAVSPVLEAGNSVMVILPTASEVAVQADLLRGIHGVRVLEVPPQAPQREVTAVWSEMTARPGRVVVGTHRIAFWPVAGLHLAVLVEEGRRAMKDRQTPTVHAREVIRRRAGVERFSVLYVGSVPSTSVLALGIELRRRSTRAWPPVEVIDRRADPGGFLADRTRAAIRGVLAKDGRVFVFTHRHGYAPAYRCVACKTLRRCPSCGSRPEPGETCTRCGADLGPCTSCGGRRFEALGAGVGRITEVLRQTFGEKAGPAGGDTPIWVGTERDIPRLERISLGVVVDADGLILGSAYNAGEESLRVFARLANAIPFGHGRHLMLQTSMPDHPVVSALKSGDPVPYLEEELESRRDLGLPPAGEVIVLEVSGGSKDPRAVLQQSIGDSATMFGPAERGGKLRWLIQGRDLSRTRQLMRGAVGRLREGGATVRVDVDPLDL